MMRKILVPATIAAALCSLSLSAAPALGFEFESETSSSTETTSSTDLVIQLGTSGSVECSPPKLESSPTLGSSDVLKVKIGEPSGCFFNDNAKGKSEGGTIKQSCPLILESTDLVEVSDTEFAEGRAEFVCKLKFETSGSPTCTVKLEKTTSPIREFEWYDTNNTLHHYESVLMIELKGMEYKISSGCGSNGTNGQLDLTAPIKYVVVPPAM
jgi:hypothetical protein